LNVDQLLKYIKQRKKEISEVMVGGGLKNMEHYQRLLGNLDEITSIEEKIKQTLDEHE
jgi:uncharacterized protein related to proFAR isomerase|tara:strand:+ start:192 stop:365 length:174 start_codon:yes stop_codon:yes gene_type:complete